MAWFCGSGFAPAAGRFSGSVSTAIADIAIAVRPAARPRGSNNGGALTAVISGVRKGDSIIATGNGNIGKNAPA
jgi:hypothetical protein